MNESERHQDIFKKLPDDSTEVEDAMGKLPGKTDGLAILTGELFYNVEEAKRRES